MTHPARPTRRSTLAGLAAALLLGAAAAPQPAQALTIVLNFVDGSTTDRNGVTTIAETFASWGFTTLDLAGVRQATLDAVLDDYLGFPSFGSNALSPLPDGRELDINFTISNGLTGPGNGDTEWYVMAIGDASPNQGFLGQACLGCVRNSAGVATVANGTIFGSSLTDTIAGLLPLASNDQQRIQLLAGTVAHEIGHGLGLPHPSGQLANPGESFWSIMATGASPSLMPSSERIKDRAFAYSEFSVLIDRVGLRDVSPIPEPGTGVVLALGLVALAWRLRAQPARPAAVAA